MNMTKQEKMRKLAEESLMTFDGGDDDRLFLDENNETNVFASIMTEEHYNQMEKEINEYSVDKGSYKVYAWNDSGGYNYWNKNNEANYIQITAQIKDVDKVDAMELLDTMNEAYDYFSCWNNTDDYYRIKLENEK